MFWEEGHLRERSLKLWMFWETIPTMRVLSTRGTWWMSSIDLTSTEDASAIIDTRLSWSETSSAPELLAPTPLSCFTSLMKLTLILTSRQSVLKDTSLDTQMKEHLSMRKTIRTWVMIWNGSMTFLTLSSCLSSNLTWFIWSYVGREDPRFMRKRCSALLSDLGIISHMSSYSKRARRDIWYSCSKRSDKGLT